MPPITTTKKANTMTYSERIFATAQKTGSIVFAAMLPENRIENITDTFVRVSANGSIEPMDAEIQADDDAAHIGEYEPSHATAWRMEVLHKGRRPIEMGLDLED